MRCSRQPGRDMSNGGIACIPPAPGPRHTPEVVPRTLSQTGVPLLSGQVRAIKRSLPQVPSSPVPVRSGRRHGRRAGFLWRIFWFLWRSSGMVVLGANFALPVAPFVLPRSAWSARTTHPGTEHPAHGHSGPEHFSDRCGGTDRSYRPVTHGSLGRPGEALAQPVAGDSKRAYSSSALADERWNV